MDCEVGLVVTRQGVTLWGGLAFTFGHFLFLVNKFNEMSRLFLGRPMPDLISGQSVGLIVLGQLLLIFGYVTYYRMYARRGSRWVTYALRVLSSGGILLTLGHVTFMTEAGRFLPPTLKIVGENLFFLVFAGVLLLLTGLIWFGFLNLRQRVLSGWRWLPLVTGLLGFCGFVLSGGEVITVTFLLFRTLFALGLIGLGITLSLEKPFTPRKLVAKAV